MDCSLPGSSVPEILQARILEWIAVSSSRGNFLTQGSTSRLLLGRQILYHWASWEAPGRMVPSHNNNNTVTDLWFITSPELSNSLCLFLLLLFLLHQCFSFSMGALLDFSTLTSTLIDPSEWFCLPPQRGKQRSPLFFLNVWLPPLFRLLCDLLSSFFRPCGW